MNEYKYIIVPLSTLALCQLIKFIIESFKKGKPDFKRLFNGSGGMPSSHTALAVSLTTMFFLNEGPSSPISAMALVFTMIVAYDGMNVRLETGKQAKTLNSLVDKIFNKNKYDKLKEEMGHKPKEVLFGILLGLTTAIVYTFGIL